MATRARHLLISSLLLCVLALCSAFLFYFLDAQKNIFYRQGLGDRPWYRLFFLFPFRFFGPTILFFIFFIPAYKTRLLLPPKGLLLISTLGVICAGFIANPFVDISPMRALVNGHIDRAVQQGLLPGIEQWAATFAKTTNGPAERFLRDSEISPLVPKLSPDPNTLADVFIGESFNFQQPVLRIRFGGGFGGWGLIVGIKDEPLTNSGSPRTFPLTDRTLGFYY
jgi:hypothetical protein